MSNRVRVALLAALSLCVLFAFGPSIVGAQNDKQGSDKINNDKYTTKFPKEEFLNTGENPYFKLEPGYELKLEGEEDGEKIELNITVTEDTEMVDGVLTRVVEERETIDGNLYEVSRNYFAIGQRTNSVYYFGEKVDFYNKRGEVIGHQGSWRSGKNGARYGMIMPGTVLLGSRYYQEIAPGKALDRAEHVSLTEEVKTPKETFQNTLKVRETTPLEPNVEEFKFYAEGVGLIKDGPLELVDYG